MAQGLQGRKVWALAWDEIAKTQGSGFFSLPNCMAARSLCFKFDLEQTLSQANGCKVVLGVDRVAI
eukprot:85926-Chlamydomonas_euryale.AAC.1